MALNLVHSLQLHRSPFLRRLVLPLLRRLPIGDIEIRHHYLGCSFLLHCYRHRGYWFHGKNRELATIESFQKIIRPGDTVIDVGAHIGYLSLVFRTLVGEGGKVLAIEPAPDNLKYLKRNLQPFTNCEIVETALADTEGEATLYVEGLTGQNNTLVPNYEVYAQNCALSHETHNYQTIQIQTSTIDRLVSERGIVPSFIKVDVEGAELQVVRGMLRVLERFRPKLMIEVTAQAAELQQLLQRYDYEGFSPSLSPLRPERVPSYNTFWLPKGSQLPSALECVRPFSRE